MPNLEVTVLEQQTQTPIVNAEVKIVEAGAGKGSYTQKTNRHGKIVQTLSNGTYDVTAEAFGHTIYPTTKQVVISGKTVKEQIEVPLNPTLEVFNQDFKSLLTHIREGMDAGLRATVGARGSVSYTCDWLLSGGKLYPSQPSKSTSDREVVWDTTGALGGQHIEAKITDSNGAYIIHGIDFPVTENTHYPVGGKISVSLDRNIPDPTADQALWSVIRNRTRAIAFNGSGYADFVDQVLGLSDFTGFTGADRPAYGTALQTQQNNLGQRILGLGAYDLLRTATQVFLLLESGAADIDFNDRFTHESLFDDAEESARTGGSINSTTIQGILANYLGADRQLPYITTVVRNFMFRDPDNNPFAPSTLIQSRVGSPPLLELIWSYWQEEGMLVQSINAISLRFQNRQANQGPDPLAHLELAPLYPLNNLLWGYVQDEQHRLTVARRNYEYNHQYGLNLVGKAVMDFHPADSRSRFLEAFHALLSLTTQFYRQADDTTIVPDPFPLLNAIREVHLVLSEGAHNQFGDLPWTARCEMLMQQWIMARPEIRQFLMSRAMVPYPQPWMAQVDTMKTVKNWTDVSVTHFNNLATYGEQILLSLRYGNWMNLNIQPASAANWAIYWRSEIQGYIHSYRAATGVDLALESRDSQQDTMRTTQPSELIHNRVKNPSVPALPPPGIRPVETFRNRRAARQQ